MDIWNYITDDNKKNINLLLLKTPVKPKKIKTFKQSKEYLKNWQKLYYAKNKERIKRRQKIYYHRKKIK